MLKLLEEERTGRFGGSDLFLEIHPCDERKPFFGIGTYQWGPDVRG